MEFVIYFERGMIAINSENVYYMINNLLAIFIEFYNLPKLPFIRSRQAQLLKPTPLSAHPVFKVETQNWIIQKLFKYRQMKVIKIRCRIKNFMI